MDYTITRHDWVDSTNTVALERGRAGAAEGTVILAEGQRKGRGRAGRVWESPYGKNLYCSIILRPVRPLGPLAAYQSLPLVMGLAVAEAISEHTPQCVDDRAVQVKWPNDVRISGKKVAGILMESVVQPDQKTMIVIGLGVNVNAVDTDFSPPVRSIATSLAIVRGHPLDRDALLAELLRHVAAAYATYCAGGFGDLRARYQQRHLLQGRQVVVRDGGGECHGTVTGIHETGALLLQTADQLCAITSGDVVRW
ncbi:MAG: biotin--[acetyl-CoA-carboxylase] ligase [Deltaproteobacteria bacterium]|nr:biotin--[acetyl-CoA-carboxylase] ligase [Deltaproteobacteria bacterium]